MIRPADPVNEEDNPSAEIFGRRDFVFVCWAAILGATIMAVVGIVGGGVSSAVGGALVAGAFSALLFFLPRLGLLRAKHMAIGVLWLVSLWVFFRGNGIRDAAVLLFPVVFMFCGITLNRRLYWCIATLSIFGVAAMGVAEQSGWIVRTYSDHALGADLYGAIVILVFAALLIDIYLNNLRGTIAELRRSRAAIAKADHTKEAFLTLVTHELRSPLNPILGFTNLLREDIADQEQRAHLDAIVDASNQLLALIDDVLSYTRVADGAINVQPESVRMCDLCDEVGGLVQAMAEEKGLNVALNCPACDTDPENAPRVVLDRERTLQILRRVAASAVAFTGEGPIAVHVERLANGAGRPVCRFIFSNIGLAVAAGEEGRVFEPFFSVGQGNEAKLASTGIGLGLATARELARLLDGELSCESSGNDRSRFVLEMPVPEQGSLDRRPGTCGNDVHVRFSNSN